MRLLPISTLAAAAFAFSPVWGAAAPVPAPAPAPAAAPAKPVAAPVPVAAAPAKPAPVVAALPSASVVPVSPPLWDPPNPLALAPDELVGPFILVDESLPQVIALYEKISGKIVLRTQVLPALKINFNSPIRIARKDAVSALETSLALNGVNITPVEGGQFCKATLNAFATQDAPPLYTDAAEVAKLVPSERFISRLYVFKNIPSAFGYATLNSLVNRTRGDTLTLFPSGNAMLFVSTVSNIKRAETIYERLDAPNSVILYKLSHIRASELKHKIQLLQSGKKPLSQILGGEFTLEADDVSNLVMVVTEKNNHEKIKALIEQFDKTDVSMKTYTVKNVRASELRKTLLALAASTGSAVGPGGKPVVAAGAARNVLRNVLLADFTIEADDATSQLFVITQPENQPKIEELILLFDKNDSALKFYEVKNLRAAEVKRLLLALQSAPPPQKGAPVRVFQGTLVGDYTIEANEITNQLLVATNPDNHKKIVEFLAEVDKNNTALYFHEVKNLRASEVKRLILSVQNSAPVAKGGAARVVQGPLVGDFTIEADDTTNQLIVATNKENHSVVKEFIAKLDKNENVLRYYDVKFVKAVDIKKYILGLQSGQGTTVARPGVAQTKDTMRNLLGGEFLLEANEMANKIIVVASPSVQEKVADIIKEMDQNSSELMVFKVKHLKASKIKRLLETLRTGRSSDGVSTPARPGVTPPNAVQNLLGGDITIDADDFGNQLIVVAQPQIREKIKNLIAQIDQDSALPMISEIVGLKHSEVENTVRALSVIVTGKSGGLLQVEGGMRVRENASGIQKFTGVATLVNSYRTYSFTNRNETQSNNPQWAKNNAVSAAGTPNSFSEYVTVSGDERTNRLMLFGSEDDVKQLKEIIAKLDTPLPQVRIEAVVVEVTLSNGEASGLDTLGLGYKASPNGVMGTGVSSVTAPDYSFGATSPQTPGTTASPFSITGSLKDFSLSILFGQAEHNSRVRILSAPLINTSHNQPATVFVGEEYPIVESSVSDLSSSTSTRSTITFKQIGLSLSVTPRVGANGSVEMKVDQNNQAVVKEIEIDRNRQPVTSTRSASAYLIANDNETVVLAGLQRYVEKESTGVVWLLGSIPLIGRLFRPETNETERSEIIIFLKPHILNPAEPQDKMPGLTPGSLTRPDAKGYLENGRFNAISLTKDEQEIIDEIRHRQSAAAKAAKEKNETKDDTAAEKKKAETKDAKDAPVKETKDEPAKEASNAKGTL